MGKMVNHKLLLLFLYVKDIIKSNNSKNVTHGMINTGMFFSVEKDRR